MRGVLFAAVAAGLTVAASGRAPVAARQPEKPAAAKDSPAAERTRTKLLKVKVSADFTGVPLREVLKEFAAQTDMVADRHVLWTYAEGVAANTPVTYACSNKPLDAALDELFTKLKLGYVVISADDQPRDGWVRVTAGGERGFAAAGTTPAPATPDDEDEKKGALRIRIAKGLIDDGKPAEAKAVLMLILNKYPKTKAAAEAKALLEKLSP